MKDYIDRSVWTNYLNEFTKRNHSRPTRLEVFGENGAQEEERVRKPAVRGVRLISL